MSKLVMQCGMHSSKVGPLCRVMLEEPQEAHGIFISKSFTPSSHNKYLSLTGHAKTHPVFLRAMRAEQYLVPKFMPCFLAKAIY